MDHNSPYGFPSGSTPVPDEALVKWAQQSGFVDPLAAYTDPSGGGNGVGGYIANPYNAFNNNLMESSANPGNHPAQQPAAISGPLAQQQQAAIAGPVALRARNQQLMARAVHPYPDGNDIEPGRADGLQLDGQGEDGYAAAGDEDDLEQLEIKAQVAKLDAKAKRKQIPPFVQKLSR